MDTEARFNPLERGRADPFGLEVRWSLWVVEGSMGPILGRALDWDRMEVGKGDRDNVDGDDMDDDKKGGEIKSMYGPDSLWGDELSKETDSHLRLLLADALSV